MTAHVKKNMVVAGEYRARPAVKQATLPSGTVLRYGSEVDQEQLLARLQEKTVDANRRLGARPETFGRFVRTKKFPAARFGDVFQLGRKHMVRSHVYGFGSCGKSHPAYASLFRCTSRISA